MTSLHVLAFKLNGPKLNSLQQTHAKQFYLLLQSELLTSDSSVQFNMTGLVAVAGCPAHGISCSFIIPLSETV